MEGLNKTSANNGQQEQSVTTGESPSFISNLTTVESNSSQVVDDFQSDSKWEFTPLEKASLDCIEMEAASYDTANDQQEIQLVTVSTLLEDQTSPKEGAQNQPQQQHASAEENKPHEQSDGTKISHGNVDDSSNSRLDYKQDLPGSIDTPNQDKEMEQSVVISEEIIETGQTTEVDKMLAGAVPISDDQKNTPIVSDLGIKKPENPNNESVPPGTNDEDPFPNNPTIFLGQSSVDAQMEKVIDNAVELGEGQHFEQVFGRSEDKAKMLESIHREITSDRSSMEIMADIALQQLPLITGTPSNQQNTSGDQSIVHLSDEADKKEAISNEGSSKNSDLTKGSVRPKEVKGEPPKEVISDQIIDEEDIIEDRSRVDDVELKSSIPHYARESQSGETVETYIDEVSSSSSVPDDACQIIPIVEEPQIDANSFTVPPKKAAEVSVEPVDGIQGQVEEVNLEPTIEKAYSVGGRDSNRDKIQDKEHKSEPTAMTDTDLEGQIHPGTAGELDSETPRRRSGRARTKVEPRDSVATPVPETKKTSSRVKGSTKKPQKDVTEPEDKAEIAKLDETDDGEKINVPNVTEYELEKDEEVKGQSPDEAPEEQPRSMRVRAPKKTQDDMLKQEEPAKRQAKRSRASKESDPNKSYEATKNTPMIKLPTQRSRATISTSNPSSRPISQTQKRKRSLSPDADDSSIEKKYSCSECNFSTDRLNNLVFHYTKSYCPGKCQMVEDMKADIIKQQQTPKSNKNKRQAR